jgi:hypothetical protein
MYISKFCSAITFFPQQVTDIERYFSEQVGTDLPVAIAEELSALHQRLLNM